MRKSREFDNILNECLERLLGKGETIEQCLRSFPEYANELEPLLQTSLDIKEASVIQPSPEFRDKARYQFYSALQETERKKSHMIFGWLPRWATVVATIVLVLLIAGGGTAVAASSSIPGEPLYPVKLATEQARMAFTFSTLGKAEFYAELADRRVLEIASLADKNEPQQIEQTAQRLDVYLTKIADLASPQKVFGGVTMAPESEEEAVTPPSEAPPLEETPPPRAAPPTPPEDTQKANIAVDRRASLRETVEHYATTHPEQLRALLETAPESVKPALLQAIAILEADYEKALESLE